MQRDIHIYRIIQYIIVYSIIERYFDVMTCFSDSGDFEDPLISGQVPTAARFARWVGHVGRASG